MERLLKINKFAKKLNHVYSVEDIDFSLLTTFNIMRKELSNEGKNIFDLPEIQNETILKEINYKTVISREFVQKIKEFTHDEQVVNKQLTQNIDELDKMIRSKLTWSGVLYRNPQVEKKLQLLTQIYFK